MCMCVCFNESSLVCSVRLVDVCRGTRSREHRPGCWYKFVSAKTLDWVPSGCY